MGAGGEAGESLRLYVEVVFVSEASPVSESVVRPHLCQPRSLVDASAVLQVFDPGFYLHKRHKLQ